MKKPIVMPLNHFRDQNSSFPIDIASQQALPLNQKLVQCCAAVYDAGPMLCRRIRRRPNFKTALVQCLVFAGMLQGETSQKMGRVMSSAGCRVL